MIENQWPSDYSQTQHKHRLKQLLCGLMSTYSYGNANDGGGAAKRKAGGMAWPFR